ncbi:MAG: winged helix-turn-helix domain-containing protein [Acidobacteriota bacterium]|nr:MAG: winged helix-turn-helix domain-containing protein [Acidobacteriota bacterium]
MNLPSRRFYEFASFRVDVAERQLLREGKPVPLTPRVFDILLVLLENAGRTVKKDRLMDKVWQDTFVEEGNLNRNISTLRKVLGDDAQSQRLIKTIPKRGYRFTSKISEIVEEDDEIVVEDRTSLRMSYTEESGRPSASSGPVRVAVALSAVFAAVAGAALVWFWMSTGEAKGRSLGTVSNSDRKEAARLFKEGRALWKTRDGKDLHKAIVLLESAVAKDPGLSPAYSALGDAYSFDSRLWRKAEGTARKAIAIDPRNGEAYATIGLVKMMWEWDFAGAEREFKEAIRLSPDYPSAHQWYAINLHAIGDSGHAALSEMQRALELDPDSTSINADLCQTLYFVWRFKEAEAQCMKALALDPGSHNARQYLFEIYSTVGRHDDAVDVYLRMNEQTLSPMPPGVLKKVRAAYETGGHRSFRKEVIVYLANSWPKHYKIAQQYAWLDEPDNAFRYLDRAYEERSFELFLFAADPAFLRYKGDPRYKGLVEKIRKRSGR